MAYLQKFWLGLWYVLSQSIEQFGKNWHFNCESFSPWTRCLLFISLWFPSLAFCSSQIPKYFMFLELFQWFCFLILISSCWLPVYKNMILFFTLILFHGLACLNSPKRFFCRFLVIFIVEIMSVNSGSFLSFWSVCLLLIFLAFLHWLGFLIQCQIVWWVQTSLPFFWS